MGGKALLAWGYIGRTATQEADRLARAAFELRVHKRELVGTH